MQFRDLKIFTIALIALAFLRPELSLAQTPSPSPNPNLVARVYQQAIDHFGDLPGQTFAQNYYIDTEYAPDPTTAPTILHVCGEGPVGGFLTDGGTSIAKALGANILYLEHRYYGTSNPFPDLSTDHLKYLTIDEAIEDLASFQTWISSTNGWTGKWISIGGSYSATLSAIYRDRHPELVVGALAASAPMISGKGESFPADTAPADQAGVQEMMNIQTADSFDNGDRPWFYEACTQVGFYESDDAENISSALYYPDPSACQQIFGTIPYVDINAFNQKYDLGFLANSPIAPSQILFTYGSNDAWTNLGLIEQTNNNPNIVIQMINGAGHHFDLNAPTAADSADVINARNQFLELAKTWLQ